MVGKRAKAWQNTIIIIDGIEFVNKSDLQSSFLAIFEAVLFTNLLERKLMENMNITAWNEHLAVPSMKQRKSKAWSYGQQQISAFNATTSHHNLHLHPVTPGTRPSTSPSVSHLLPDRHCLGEVTGCELCYISVPWLLIWSSLKCRS